MPRRPWVMSEVDFGNGHVGSRSLSNGKIRDFPILGLFLPFWGILGHFCAISDGPARAPFWPYEGPKPPAQGQNRIFPTQLSILDRVST